MNFLCKDTESCVKEKKDLNYCNAETKTKKQKKQWECKRVDFDLLHFGVEVYVTVCDDELNGLVGDILIRRLHGYSPDEVHPN